MRITWQELWAFYIAQDSDIQQDTINKLNLDELLRGLDWKQQVKVLRGAPNEVIEMVSVHLHFNTRIAFMDFEELK